MTAIQRRDKLLLMLENANAPISASQLAEALGVSRQIIVGDVALVRAANVPITATPRGYVLESGKNENRYTIACKHSKAQLLQELYTIVDCGCSVLDVTVEHPVYGQMSGGLHINSRFDADLFLNKLNENEAQPLLSLTGDVHLHTVHCPTEKHYKAMLQKLSENGFLVK